MEMTKTRELLLILLKMEDSDIIPERINVTREMVDKVLNPDLQYNFFHVMFFMENLDLMGFVDKLNHFKSNLKENVSDYFREYMNDLMTWVEERNGYDFDDLRGSIRYYAKQVKGIEKNSIIGLITYLIKEDRTTEFSSMSNDARIQMYLYAFIVIDLPLWGEE